MLDIRICVLLLFFLYLCNYYKSYINGGNTKKIKKYNKKLNKKNQHNTHKNNNKNNNNKNNNNKNNNNNNNNNNNKNNNKNNIIIKNNNINNKNNNINNKNIIDSDLYSTSNYFESDNNVIPLHLKDLKKIFYDIKFNIGDKVLLLKNNKLGIIINNKTNEGKKYLIKLIDNNKKLYEYENNIKIY